MVYSLNRLRAVPQDGHASTEEIERSERKKTQTEAKGKLGRRPLSRFPLGYLALSSLTELRLD